MFNANIQNWILASRPKTLPAAIAPVMIGTAMAYGDGVHHWLTALICLITAILIQIGTNLANDYFDFKKGTDTEERVGPKRVTQSGLIKPETVRTAFILTFTLAALGCWWLAQRGGWPIATLAVIAILSGILYTAGPWPLGYIGLGDIFVLLFFGLVAVGGTYYVQSYEINLAVILAGFGPGLISMAILTVNNLRDIDSDAKAGKKTLAVRFGKSFAQSEYIFSILGASLVPVLIFGLIHDHLPILICAIVSLIAIPTIKVVLTKSDGPSLNNALATTGKLLMIYSVMFSIGWVL